MKSPHQSMSGGNESAAAYSPFTGSDQSLVRMDLPRRLVEADAQRDRGRPRGEDDGYDEQRGEHEKLAGGRKAGGSRVDRASTEDQHRHVERQDKKREQHAAAAQSERERRTDGADEAEHRRAKQERKRQHAVERTLD